MATFIASSSYYVYLVIMDGLARLSLLYGWFLGLKYFFKQIVIDGINGCLVGLFDLHICNFGLNFLASDTNAPLLTAIKDIIKVYGKDCNRLIGARII